jgi:hypothetical protein
MALGTGVAAGPRCFAYAALGGSLDNLDRPEAKVAVAVLVAMALIGLLAARYRLPGGRGRRRSGPEQPDPPDRPARP